jgi:hypothetical protein
MESYGTSCLCCTDSAGYMLPDDVTARIRVDEALAVQKVLDDRLALINVFMRDRGHTTQFRQIAIARRDRATTLLKYSTSRCSSDTCNATTEFQ